MSDLWPWQIWPPPRSGAEMIMTNTAAWQDQRTGRYSDDASFTIETFARYFIHDPVHHLYDVTGSRRPPAVARFGHRVQRDRRDQMLLNRLQLRPEHSLEGDRSGRAVGGDPPGAGRRPVLHTCSAVTPAWLTGTPGPDRTTSDDGFAVSECHTGEIRTKSPPTALSVAAACPRRAASGGSEAKIWPTGCRLDVDQAVRGHDQVVPDLGLKRAV